MNRPRTILVVDADPSVLAFTSETLSAQGYGVVAAEDWTTAIDAIQESPIDVALLDLNLPEIGGDALLQFILEQSPDVSVVIASEQIDGEGMEALGRLGARGFIRKPIEADELQVVVEQVLLEREVMEAPAAARKATAPPPGGAAPSAASGSPANRRVAPGSGVSMLPRLRQPMGTPAADRPRRVHKHRGHRLRGIRNYLLVGVLVILAGLILWVAQQAFSGGILGIGFTQSPPG